MFAAIGTVEPTLVVLLYSSLAAGVAAAGVLPLAGGRTLPTHWIGWSNALAGGLMLGVAYALLVSAHDPVPLGGALGGLLGILVVNRTHAASGTANLDLNRLHETSPDYGYKVLLVNGIHSAAEGVAIGAAMAVNLSFGVFTALAIAVHNVPEGTVLAAILTSRRVRLRDAAGLAVATNAGQVLLAIVTFALIVAAPGLMPWALGFAVGSLVYLVLAELLPECYREAGSTSIALVTLVAMGVVALLVSLGPGG